MKLKIWIWGLALLFSGLAFSHPGIHEQVDSLNERIKQKPSYQLYAQRAHLYFEGGQLDLSLKDLDTAAKMGPKEPLLFEYGNIYLVKGDHSKALKYLNQFIKFNPQLAEAYVARAKAYQKLDRYSESIQDLKQSIKLHPSPHPGLYIEAANLIYTNQKNQLEPALNLLDEGIQRIGVQGQLQERAIELLIENKQDNLAIDRMKLLGNERKKNVFWRYDLAQLFMKTGRTAEARTELKRAISETKGMESAAVAELRNKINQQLSKLP